MDECLKIDSLNKRMANLISQDAVASMIHTLRTDMEVKFDDRPTMT